MNQAVKCFEEVGELSQFFDQMIDSFEKEKASYIIGNMSPEKESFWKRFSKGDNFEMATYANLMSSKTILSSLVDEFFHSLESYDLEAPIKLAVHFSNRQMLVWVVLPDDREDMEFKFYGIEADVNRKFRQYGFTVNTTILEESDGAKTPPQYKVIVS
jgi:hypothetical protein